jgi:hypothetical protein
VTERAKLRRVTVYVVYHKCKVNEFPVSLAAFSD